MSIKQKNTFNPKAIIYAGIGAIIILLIIAGVSRVQGAVVSQDSGAVEDVTFSEESKNMSKEKDYADQKSMPQQDSKRTPASYDEKEQKIEKNMEYHDKEYLYDRKYK